MELVCATTVSASVSLVTSVRHARRSAVLTTALVLASVAMAHASVPSIGVETIALKMHAPLIASTMDRVITVLAHAFLAGAEFCATNPSASSTALGAESALPLVHAIVLLDSVDTSALSISATALLMESAMYPDDVSVSRVGLAKTVRPLSAKAATITEPVLDPPSASARTDGPENSVLNRFASAPFTESVSLLDSASVPLDGRVTHVG